MKKTSLLFTLLILLMSTTGLFAQSGKIITGSVRDAEGRALPSVTVIEKGTQNSTVTSDGGAFTITLSKDNASLEFSSIGFTTQDVPVGKQTSITVTLEANAQNLGEVVVTTALGIKRQRKSLGFAVQEVKGSVLVDAKETNLANALTGKVAGLQVVRSSNGAGGSSKINLRGFTSLTGSNQPLIVVDGMPINNFTGTTENGYWGAGLDLGSGLGDLSADDIESMNVLKGPSAAALYGSRAGNGVIMIVTKSGRRTPGLGITLSTTLGTESIFTKPELQNTFGQGSENIHDPMSTLSWGPKAEGQTITNWNGTQGPMSIDNNVDAFLRNGTNQIYNLGLQQQFGNTLVYSSISYMEDRSIIPGNKLKRVNLTNRVTTRFGKNDRWTSDVKFQYNNTSGYNRPINGRDNSSVYVLYMLPRSLNIRDFSAATNEFGQMLWYPGAPGSQSNPYWLSKYNLNNDVRNRFIISGSLKYNFTDWLDAEVKVGGDLYTTSLESKTYAGGPLANSYSTRKETFNELNYMGLITAKKNNVVGKFGGVAYIGGNIMTRNYSSLGVGTGQLQVPNLFSPTNSAGIPSITAYEDQQQINSLFGTVGVNYDNWLFLDMTARNDWSSNLVKMNQSYFYPSFTLSWVVTDMLETMNTKLPGWFSYAKIRASHATVGNDMAPYNLYNGYTISQDPLGNIIAARESLLKDPNVKSELIKNLEFGTELRFFNNRVGIDLSWYKSNATRQLIRLPMDPMSGFSERMINAGNIQNQGIELVLDVRLMSKANGFNWSLTANASRNENKILDIAKDLNVNTYPLGNWDDLFIRANTNSLYGDIYGTKFLRVQDQSSPYYNQVILTAEGLPQRDPTIVKLGNQQAKGLIGVTNNFSYKGIGFSFLIDARLGGEIFAASNVGLQSAGTAAITAPGGERPDFVVDGVILDGSGQPSKNTVAVSQQRYWNAVSTLNNLGVGEAYIYDATNVRLRNVMLSYELPKKILGKSIQNARIAVSCNNVWMITSHLNGIDPESVFATGSNAVGFENGAFPTMRSFLFTLNLGF